MVRISSFLTFISSRGRWLRIIRRGLQGKIHCWLRTVRMGWLVWGIRFRLRNRRSCPCKWPLGHFGRRQEYLSLRLSRLSRPLIRRYRPVSCLWKDISQKLIRSGHWRLVHRHRRRQRLICLRFVTIRRWLWRSLRSLIRVNRLRNLTSHQWRRRVERIILLGVIGLRSWSSFRCWSSWLR